MKPNALRWHFDRPSLHLRPHGVQRFFASASNLKLPLEVNGNAVRHKSLAGPDLTFGDIAGKLHMLQIECTRCARKGRYSVAKLLAQHGHRGNMSKGVSDLSGDCHKRNAAHLHERCDLICPDLPKML